MDPADAAAARLDAFITTLGRTLPAAFARALEEATRATFIQLEASSRGDLVNSPRVAASLAKSTVHEAPGRAVVPEGPALPDVAAAPGPADVPASANMLEPTSPPDPLVTPQAPTPTLEDIFTADELGFFAAGAELDRAAEEAARVVAEMLAERFDERARTDSDGSNTRRHRTGRVRALLTGLGAVLVLAAASKLGRPDFGAAGPGQARPAVTASAGAETGRAQEAPAENSVGRQSAASPRPPDRKAPASRDPAASTEPHPVYRLATLNLRQ